jgi:hypothetical protein
VRASSDHTVPDEWERDERAVAWEYGSILTAAAVAVATDVKASGPGQVLLYTAATMVVIWLAHSFATFVGHGGRVDLPGLPARLWHATVIESPVLASAAPTCAAVAVCWVAGASVNTTGTVGLAAAVSTMVLIAAGRAGRTGAGTRGLVGAGAMALVLGGVITAAKISLG